MFYEVYKFNLMSNFVSILLPFKFPVSFETSMTIPLFQVSRHLLRKWLGLVYPRRSNPTPSLPPPEGLLQSSNLVGGSDSFPGQWISGVIFRCEQALLKSWGDGWVWYQTNLLLRLSGLTHVKIVCVLIWCSLLTLTQSTLAEVVKALVASSLSAPAIVRQSQQ